jgi:hypothetical protein
MLLAATPHLCGQERGHAANSNDIRTFLIESQIVEYRPKHDRDPFGAAQEGKGRVVEEDDELTIDGITLQGSLIDAKKKVYLIVLDSHQVVRQLPVGFRFKDGEITAITDAGAVFSTWDPALGLRSPVKRTVTKNFKREDGK